MTGASPPLFKLTASSKAVLTLNVAQNRALKNFHDGYIILDSPIWQIIHA